MTHSTLAVSATRVPLGLWEQQVWVRAAEQVGKRQRRHARRFEDKESYKWVTGVSPAVTADLAPQVITVCDRDADVNEFLDQALVRGLDFIVRATRERKLDSSDAKLFARVRQMPIQQRMSVTLQHRPDRDARIAQVELRYGGVTLVAPPRARTEHKTLRVQVVEVSEPDAPVGEDALHWVLLTSLGVETPQQAEQIVRWYSFRWLIERFHYVLKRGCHLEARQLRAQRRLKRLLAVFNLVAWRLLWLTHQARQTPEVSCRVALVADEWQALYAHLHRSTQMPPTPPTLHEAVGWIAQLGGFLGRSADGEPGVKVLWRGWQRLKDIVAT